jgi:hypothetical protein
VIASSGAALTVCPVDTVSVQTRLPAKIRHLNPAARPHHFKKATVSINLSIGKFPQNAIFNFHWTPKSRSRTFVRLGNLNILSYRTPSKQPKTSESMSFSQGLVDAKRPVKL